MKYKIDLTDKCPSCGKKVANMMKDKGAIITIPFGVACSSCGTHFALHDMIKKVFEAKEHRIIEPGTENALSIPQDTLLTKP